jgi:2-polyprenyl-3-methyl-5-hydroxy-6-metoxy-1,4-benzoquinol methylase
MYNVAKRRIPMDAVLCRCAICCETGFLFWFRTEFGSIGRCRKCRQVLRIDRPTREAHVDLHRSANLHLTPYATLTEAAVAELRFYNAFLDLLPNGSGKSILDVGCGVGEFLQLASKRGFQAVGIEPAEPLRMLAQKAAPEAKIHSGDLESAAFPPESFDCVAIWDVIEHLVDPRGALVFVHQLLKPGGYLGIATINHASLMYGIYHAWRRTIPQLARHFGPMLFNPFHTYYFTKKSLATLVGTTGFEIVEHRGYEFPLSRLAVSGTIKAGMRGLYLLQRLCGLEGEQYLFAKKRSRV